MRTKSTYALLTVALVAALFLTGCGHDHEPAFIGDIVLANATDLFDPGPPEDVVGFYVAAFGQPFTGDLLGGVFLPPNSERYLGTFNEDYYDAIAELFSGIEIDWYDEFVGEELTTFFEVR